MATDSCVVRGHRGCALEPVARPTEPLHIEQRSAEPRTRHERQHVGGGLERFSRGDECTGRVQCGDLVVGRGILDPEQIGIDRLDERQRICGTPAVKRVDGDRARLREVLSNHLEALHVVGHAEAGAHLHESKAGIAVALCLVVKLIEGRVEEEATCVARDGFGSGAPPPQVSRAELVLAGREVPCRERDRIGRAATRGVRADPLDAQQCFERHPALIEHRRRERACAVEQRIRGHARIAPTHVFTSTGDHDQMKVRVVGPRCGEHWARYRCGYAPDLDLDSRIDALVIHGRHRIVLRSSG
ncbi:unannotated protein [freshwater metagenome]|uniref:Unannotated protein n=1 Tax=freshwater metagenome TaxID=449393 RepID=A0A6J7AR86_9ZZZZ